MDCLFLEGQELVVFPDGEGRIHAGLYGIFPQHLVAETVDGGDGCRGCQLELLLPEGPVFVRRTLVQPLEDSLADPFRHLFGGFPGEGDGQDFLSRSLFLCQDLQKPFHQYPGLAGTGPGGHGYVPVQGRNGLLLLFCKVCHVHSSWDLWGFSCQRQMSLAGQ